MQRFILTGAPGAGKTTIVRQLAGQDCKTVAEAATDIIAREQAAGVAEPWTAAGFVAKIAQLQKQRIAAATGWIQCHDRSPICTLALARHLGVPVPPILERLLDRIATQRLFEPSVFIVDSLDFIEKTAARRIDLEEARAFGRLHAQAYAELGYRLVSVPAGPVATRVEQVRAHFVA
ncbi:AAA family ATPase [Parasphingopyxis lamellibrachiae]|uniref:Putative ATPase n=1 Tax=Parasphingopyxis lamellibrachiae TaxID=680125 RepID=A0A3D9FH51_9SPHN|nr:AAA family ATPase [Parasphingopyxis lamellibrachiae]RED16892.1 putative ATPase [Parasphingopyxis lamellibrachiae]